ncbi:hypothetical protein [Paenibacillus solani]|uniref:hypothetical protein n=1 Tax=Paenibacillus solani TaxID=1705565 RepID=UPI001F5F4B30|nr:hypothetical protein [Paenibacillus solani]
MIYVNDFAFGASDLMQMLHFTITEEILSSFLEGFEVPSDEGEIIVEVKEQ